MQTAISKMPMKMSFSTSPVITADPRRPWVRGAAWRVQVGMAAAGREVADTMAAGWALGDPLSVVNWLKTTCILHGFLSTSIQRPDVFGND